MTMKWKDIPEMEKWKVTSYNRYKVFEEYLKCFIYLNKDKDKIIIAIKEAITKPKDAGYYNSSRKFSVINLDINILPSLETGKEEINFNMELVPKKDSSVFLSFEQYQVLSNHPDYSIMKDTIDSIDYYGIEPTSWDKHPRVNLGKGSESIAKKYTLRMLKSIIKKRIKELYSAKLMLEKCYTKKRALIVKPDKQTYFFSYDTKKIISYVYSKDECYLIKEFIYSNKKLDCPFDFIKELSIFLEVKLNKSCKYTIDNGWGSYTYTYMWNYIDSYPKKIVDYLIWYYQFKFDMVTENHYLRFGKGMLGMVQKSGYTYVS